MPEASGGNPRRQLDATASWVLLFDITTTESAVYPRSSLHHNLLSPHLVAMPYTYTKLAKPTAIRLIQVIPEKVDDTIACIIHTYDTQQLKQEGQYKSYRALSYRWGDPDTTRSVYLKDPTESEWHLHPVHENLWRFIEYVWQQGLFQDRFWTDYFCLDQCSDEEKRQQIPRMNVIFAEATDVIIWLGLSEIEEQHITRYLGWDVRGPRPIKRPRDESFNTAKALCSNEYWSRVWIVQEVALASPAVIVMRSQSIGLNDLWKRFLNTLPASYELDYELEYPFFNDLNRLATSDVKSRQMWKLLRDYISGGYQCKEPNDRLYGFLGLLNTPNDYIIIDYKRPYGHVILDAVFEAATDGSPVSIPAILDNFSAGQMPLGLTTNANELEEYLHEGRTLPRHKELAHLALIAFDATSLIMTTRGAPQRCRGMSDAHRALSPATSNDIQSEAIFLGVTLSYGPTKTWASKLLQHWKSCRYPQLQKQSWRSPWLCKWHCIEDHMQDYIRRCDNGLSVDEYMKEYMAQYIRKVQDKPSRYAYLKEYQRVFKRLHDGNISMEQYMRVHNRWHSETHYFLRASRTAPDTREAGSSNAGGYFRAGMEEACRHAGEHCDGSTMFFEIPHAFFRMTISSGIRLEFFDKDTWT